MLSIDEVESGTIDTINGGCNIMTSRDSTSRSAVYLSVLL